MDVLLKFPLEISLSFVGISFSLVNLILLVFMLVKLLHLKEIRTVFVTLCLLQVSLLILVFYSLLSTLDRSFYDSRVLALLGMVSVCMFGVHTVFSMPAARLRDKFLVFLPFSMVLLGLIGIGNLTFTVLILVSLGIISFVTLGSLVSEVSYETALYASSFLASVFLLVVYLLGYESTLLILVGGSVLSVYTLLRIFLGFRKVYVSFAKHREIAQTEVLRVSDLLRGVSLLWEEVNKYRSEHLDLTLSLNSEIRRVYNYVRYIKNLVSSYQDKVIETRFEFEEYLRSVSALVDNVEALVSDVERVESTSESLNATLETGLREIHQRMNVFKGFSESIGSFLLELKGVREKFSEVNGLLEKVSEVLSFVASSFSFVEQVSVEGEMSASSFDISTLSEAFGEIKRRSYDERGKINVVKGVIEIVRSKITLLIDKISELETEMYNFLSLSDAVVNISGNIIRELESSKVDLRFEDALTRMKNIKEGIKSECEEFKENSIPAIRDFSVLDESFITLTSIDGKITDLVNTASLIADVTEVLSSSLDSMKQALDSIRKDVEVTLV